MILLTYLYHLTYWGLVIITAMLWYKYFFDYDYWRRRGVPFHNPLPFVGNMYEALTMRLSVNQQLIKLYNESSQPLLGIYILHKPFLLLRSPHLIQSVLIKDFDYFCDRYVEGFENADPIFANMLAVKKHFEWKLLRAKISPLFTSGKLRNMWSLMADVSERFNVYVGKHVDTTMEAKELCAKYTTDIIASCAFGIDAYSFEYKNTQFMEVGRRFFGLRWQNMLGQACYFLFPSIAKIFNIPFFDTEATNFTREVFWQTIRKREETKAVRNDLIDILIEIKNMPHDDIKFEGDMIVAQAFAFFAAGFETTSTVLAFALYELCVNPEIQNRLRDEIETVVDQHGGFTYNAIREMKFLHMILLETMRKYPSVPFIDRLCVKDYKVADTDLIIEKGTPVFISLFAVHYDPNNYPDPEKFDPERFSDENKGNIRSCAYLAFGEGPHSCIGNRFGLTAAKMGITGIVANYQIEPCDNTPIPVVFETKSLLLAARGGIPLKFTKITSDRH